MINANIYLIAIPDTNPGSLQVVATILGGMGTSFHLYKARNQAAFHYHPANSLVIITKANPFCYKNNKPYSCEQSSSTQWTSLSTNAVNNLQARSGQVLAPTQ